MKISYNGELRPLHFSAMAEDNDEAIARALQEMEDGGTENMFIKETNGISAGKCCSLYPS